MDLNINCNIKCRKDNLEQRIWKWMMKLSHIILTNKKKNLYVKVSIILRNKN